MMIEDSGGSGKGAERIYGRDELIDVLTRHREELESFGVKRIGIFGSFVRDEMRSDSDVDVVVEFEEGKATFRNVGGLIEYLESLFNRPIDLLTPAGIDSIRDETVREGIKREVVYV